MYELMRPSIIERPERCVLKPALAKFANIHDGNYCGTYADASLYRNVAR